jgi:hypothetical protein
VGLTLTLLMQFVDVVVIITEVVFRSDVELRSTIHIVSKCRKQLTEIGPPDLPFIGLRELKFQSDIRLSPPFFKFEQNKSNMMSFIGRNG